MHHTSESYTLCNDKAFDHPKMECTCFLQTHANDRRQIESAEGMFSPVHL